MSRPRIIAAMPYRNSLVCVQRQQWGEQFFSPRDGGPSDGIVERSTVKPRRLSESPKRRQPATDFARDKELQGTELPNEQTNIVSLFPFLMLYPYQYPYQSEIDVMNSPPFWNQTRRERIGSFPVPGPFGAKSEMKKKEKYICWKKRTGHTRAGETNDIGIGIAAWELGQTRARLPRL
ncbi:hypothetical protein BJV74DRAFT_799458 [Russula compacta]|nr:hypothetical protein BJV74DRAFT_799458 [Russula compacta]